MNVTRWDPFRELEEVSERLNRVFGRPAGNRENREQMTLADWSPAVDIFETDKDYVIKVEIPEVSKDDVKVTVQQGVLTIRGERRQQKEEKGRRYHRIERAYGSFVRNFTVPDDVDDTKIGAEAKEGLLLVRLPKTEKAKPHAIEVKVG